MRVLVRKSSANRASIPTCPSPRTHGTAATRCFEATTAVGGTVVAVLAATAIAVPIEVGALLAARFAVVSVLAVVTGGGGGFSFWGRCSGGWGGRKDGSGAGESTIDGDERFCFQGKENVVDELLRVCVGCGWLVP